MWDDGRWLNNDEAVQVLLKEWQDFQQVLSFMREADKKSREAFDKRIEEQKEEKRAEEKRLEKQREEKRAEEERLKKQREEKRFEK
jgi:hypothetical protein